MRPTGLLAALALVVAIGAPSWVARAQNISTFNLPARELTITGAQILTHAYIDTTQLFGGKLFPLDDGKKNFHSPLILFWGMSLIFLTPKQLKYPTILS